MAIDTRNKRSSAIHVGLPWRGMFPVPDGAISQADRQHAAAFYAGILAGEGMVVVPEHFPTRLLAGTYAKQANLIGTVISQQRLTGNYTRSTRLIGGEG